MRTTLAIDDDVLAAAKAMARQQNRSLGEVVSELARRSLRPAARPSSVRAGVPLLPARPGVLVTPDDVNALRDDGV